MESHDAEFSEAGRGWARGPKPTPDVTMSADELALRLLTSREHLARTEAERLLVEVRAVGRPSRFRATPAEIDQFLREHFAEDRIQLYQWAIGDAAAHEAAEEQRVEFGEISAQGRRGGWHGVQDFIDTAKGAGHYPSELIDFTPKES